MTRMGFTQPSNTPYIYLFKTENYKIKIYWDAIHGASHGIVFLVT
jgi:hypothetical protein